MAKQYDIRIRGTQREAIDADLMAQLVVMLGRQLAEDARQAAEAAREPEVEAPSGDRTDETDQDHTAGQEAA